MCSSAHVTTESLFGVSVTFLTAKFNNFPHNNGGPGSSVGIATDYGLGGPGSNRDGDEIFCPSKLAVGPPSLL